MNYLNLIKMDMKRNRFIIIPLILFCYLISSCGISLLFNHRITDIILNIGEEIEIGKDTIIDLSANFGGRIDCLYVSGEAIPPKQISDEIGFNYYGPWVYDSEYRIILIRDQSIIYQENLKPVPIKGLSLDVHPCHIHNSCLMRIYRVNKTTLEITWY